jgi:hypothetical protein
MDEPQHSNAVRHLQVIYTDIAQRVRAIGSAPRLAVSQGL